MSTIDKIIKILEQKHISQKDLTDYLGLDKSTFSAWKNGKSKSYVKYLSQISEYLNVTVDYLLNNEPVSKSAELEDVYFSLAKSAQDEGIAPEDIKLAIETIKAMRKK